MELLENILSQEMVQRLGWMLVHFVWQASMVALLLAILLKLLRRSSANLRYIVACLALAMVVLLPVITMNLIPVAESYSAAEAAVVPAPEPVAIIPIPAEIELPANIETPAIETELPVQDIAASPVIPLRQRITEVFEPTLPYVVIAWLVGVFGLSLWYLGGWTQLQRLKQRMVKPVDESLSSKLKELAGVLGINRAVQLRESALVGTPTVVGWLKPVILLPASVLTGFSADQLEAILAHELAHIKRYDYLVNMLQTVVEILGFYHPAVWWVSKKIRVERENCCDDIAVRISGDSIGYAKTLALFDGIRAGQSELAVAASGGSLFERICRLIQKDSTNIKADWMPSVITIVLILALLIPTGLALTARSEEKHAVQAIKEIENAEVSRKKHEISGRIFKPVSHAWWDDYFAKIEAAESEDEFMKAMMNNDNRPEQHPATGAVVTVRSGSFSAQTTTDSEGNFGFIYLPAGPYTLSYSYLSRSRSGQEQIITDERNIPFEGHHGKTHQTRLTLRSDAITVKGRITDANGKPIAGAKIIGTKLLRDIHDEVEFPDPVHFVATSRADGSYELKGIKPSKRSFLDVFYYLSEGNVPLTGFLLDVKVETEGFGEKNVKVPLLTEGLLYRGRRFLEAYNKGMQKMGFGQYEKEEKEQLPYPIPISHTNVITAPDIVID